MQVRVIQAPANCIAPDVFLDAQGVLHMVYGMEPHAYYVRSTDNGATFTPPVQVDGAEQATTTMGERGPKVAVDGDGIVHVIWADRWFLGAKCYARYTRSTDGGKTFEPPKAVSSMPGIDGVTMTANAKGHVLAFWHVMADPKPDVPEATWLYMSRSTDHGATFGPSEPVKISNYPPLACSMCMMRARATDDGTVYVAFRAATKNIRDFWVLKGSSTANDFTATRVNEDNWEIPTCPMCGPELTFAPDGRMLCGFMSKHKVYWSISDATVANAAGANAAAGAKFTVHAATPENANDEIYPAAFANKAGDVLFLWQVGPMSVKATAVVHWALYSADGKATGKQDTLGTSFSGTKPTAFVGTDDNFYVVTTAKKTQ